jgi:hypothetical protein
VHKRQLEKQVTPNAGERWNTCSRRDLNNSIIANVIRDAREETLATAGTPRLLTAERITPTGADRSTRDNRNNETPTEGTP